MKHNEDRQYETTPIIITRTSMCNNGQYEMSLDHVQAIECLKEARPWPDTVNVFSHGWMCLTATWSVLSVK